MSWLTVRWAKLQRCDTPGDKSVLVHLATYADRQHRAWPSHAALAADTQMTRPSVTAALATLESQGLIESAEERKPNGRWEPKAYVLHVSTDDKGRPTRLPTYKEEACKDSRQGPCQDSRHGKPSYPQVTHISGALAETVPPQTPHEDKEKPKRSKENPMEDRLRSEEEEKRRSSSGVLLGSKSLRRTGSSLPGGAGGGKPRTEKGEAQ